MTQFGIRKVLERNTIIPVVTIYDLNEIPALVSKLKERNLNCAEVTLRTPVAMAALKTLKQEYSDELEIGVGTVVHSNQLEELANIGVDFIVSPGLTEEVIRSIENHKIPFIPGVVSPSEIMKGIALGCDTFKFFPAELSGGIKMLKTFASLFPEVKFCPTGGINESNYKSYLQLPNVMSVGGSWLI